LLKQVHQIVNVNLVIHNNVSNTWSGAVPAFCTFAEPGAAKVGAIITRIGSTTRGHAARAGFGSC
jgi:hypothetical protein